MSMLSDLRAAIEAHPDARLVVEQEQQNFSYDAETWNHFVEIFVAPHRGMYTVNRLNDFMASLTPVPPTMNQPFKGYHNGRVFWGYLHFDEVIGEVVTTGTRMFTSSDPDLLLPDGAVNGKPLDITKTISLKRRTIVRFFPDSIYARKAAQGVEHTVSAGPVLRNHGLTLVKG